MTLLSYDHKVALFDRLAPHFETISRALGRRVEDLGDGSKEGFAAHVAQNAVDGAHAALHPVPLDAVADPEPFRSRSWLDGAIVVTWRPGQFATLTLVLSRLCVCLGVELIPDGPSRITLAPEIAYHRGVLSTDLELQVLRGNAWAHASLEVK